MEWLGQIVITVLLVLVLAPFAEFGWHWLCAPWHLQKRENVDLKSQASQSATEIESLQDQIMALQRKLKGDISIEIEEGFFGDGEIQTPLGERIQGAFVFLAIIIRNNDDPVAFDGFRCGLVIDEQIVWGYAQGIPDERIEIKGPGGVLQRFAHEDDIKWKTSQPIPNGGYARGKTIYFFPAKGTALALQNSKTPIQVDARDVKGRLHTGTKLANELPNRPMLNYPGVTRTTEPPGPSEVSAVIRRRTGHLANTADGFSTGTPPVSGKVEVSTQPIADALLAQYHYGVHKLANRILLDQKDTWKDANRQWEHDTKDELERLGCTPQQVESFWSFTESDLQRYGTIITSSTRLNRRAQVIQFRLDALKRIINHYSDHPYFT